MSSRVLTSDARTENTDMKMAPPRPSAASVRTSRPLRRNVLRIDSNVGRGRPRMSRSSRSNRPWPNRSLIPVDARASRTVIRTPRWIGTRAASRGTTSPITTSSAITSGGIETPTMSKLARPAVNWAKPYAPTAPSGSATASANTA